MPQPQARAPHVLLSVARAAVLCLVRKVESTAPIPHETTARDRDVGLTARPARVRAPALPLVPYRGLAWRRVAVGFCCSACKLFFFFLYQRLLIVCPAVQ